MKSKMLFATAMVGMLLVGAMGSVEAQAATVRYQTHKQSNSHGNATSKRKGGKVKKAVGDVGTGTKDTGKGIVKGGENAGDKVAQGSETAAKATAGGVKDASKATAKGAKKTGKATANGAKKVGSVFK